MLREVVSQPLARTCRKRTAAPFRALPHPSRGTGSGSSPRVRRRAATVALLRLAISAISATFLPAFEHSHHYHSLASPPPTLHAFLRRTQFRHINTCRHLAAQPARIVSSVNTHRGVICTTLKHAVMLGFPQLKPALRVSPNNPRLFLCLAYCSLLPRLEMALHFFSSFPIRPAAR